MSLRYQINPRILIPSLCILLLGGSIAVWQVHHAVDKEVESSINLAVQLITFGFSQASQNPRTDAIITVCDHLMTVVRSMMHQLHPLVLAELGLKATLEDLLNHWAIRNPALKISMDCPDEVDALAQKITIQVFRVVQECLTNSVRHAQARQASISLEILRPSTTQNMLKLCVTDDGQGCAPEGMKTGFGLLGMRERNNSLGGELMIQTQPGQGMRITASIPLT